MTDDIIDIKEMEYLTRHVSFKDTMYIISPALLYEFGNVYLRSVKGSHISLFLSFPEISRSDTMKVINVISPSFDMHLHQTKPRINFQFLLPDTITMSRINISLHSISNADTCLSKGTFMACYSGSPLISSNLHCLRSIVQNDSHPSCFGERKKGNYLIDFGKNGALLETDGKGEIFDAKTGDILHYLRGHVCTYVPKRQRLAVEIDEKVSELSQSVCLQDG